MTSRSSERLYWNRLYRRSGYVYGTRPSQYLCAQQFRLHPGMTALLLGDGEARNGVWMASLGLDVVSIDWSSAAIAKGRRLAKDARVSLTFCCHNLLTWNWPQERFDAAVAIHCHLTPANLRPVARRITACLKPGGVFILEGFHCSHGNGTATERFYTAALVKEYFRDLEIIEFREELDILDEGPMHQGPATLVRFTGRKPQPTALARANQSESLFEGNI